MSLEAIKGIDVPILLRAISIQETSGAERGIRVEASWLPRGIRVPIQGNIVIGTGRNYDRSVSAPERWGRWGWWSACSFGAFQVLYHTAVDYCGWSLEKHPALLDDATNAYDCAHRLLERIVARGAWTVRQIADEWNTGSHNDSYHNLEYETSVETIYKRLIAQREAIVSGRP